MLAAGNRNNKCRVSGGKAGRKMRTMAAIEKALANKNAGARRKACYALWRLGGDKALALLEHALEDKAAEVRATAFAALDKGRFDRDEVQKIIEGALWR